MGPPSRTPETAHGSAVTLQTKVRAMESWQAFPKEAMFSGSFRHQQSICVGFMSDAELAGLLKGGNFIPYCFKGLLVSEVPF